MQMTMQHQKVVPVLPANRFASRRSDRERSDSANRTPSREPSCGPLRRTAGALHVTPSAATDQQVEELPRSARRPPAPTTQMLSLSNSECPLSRTGQFAGSDRLRAVFDAEWNPPGVRYLQLTLVRPSREPSKCRYTPVPGRHACHPTERGGEMTLVGKAAGKRDVADPGYAVAQQLLGACHARAAHILAQRAAEMLVELAADLYRVPADRASDCS